MAYRTTRGKVTSSNSYRPRRASTAYNRRTQGGGKTSARSTSSKRVPATRRPARTTAKKRTYARRQYVYK